MIKLKVYKLIVFLICIFKKYSRIVRLYSIQLAFYNSKYREQK